MGLALTNNRVGSRLARDVAPIDTTVASGAINAGDMIYWTGTGVASLNTPGATNANAAAFLGVSNDQYPIPYSDNLTETVTNPTVTYCTEGFYAFKTHAGDSFAPFTAVYLGADGQTVTTTASGDAVGTVACDQSAVGGLVGSTITGAAGQKVVVLITPNKTPTL